jgi:homoaconitate hydratase
MTSEARGGSVARNIHFVHITSSSCYMIYRLCKLSIEKPLDSTRLLVAGSFSSIFARNSINNALLGIEVPRLVERLRAAFPSSEKVPTRRTGWTLTWDISRSTIKVQEGEDGECWEEKVGQFPENLQEIIAKGGLTEWVKHEIANVAV